MRKIVQLCWTGTTLYALDEQGYIWYINLRDGSWELHGNPTDQDFVRESRGGEEGKRENESGAKARGGER
jgi:hypothetical protein